MGEGLGAHIMLICAGKYTEMKKEQEKREKDAEMSKNMFNWCLCGDRGIHKCRGEWWWRHEKGR